MKLKDFREAYYDSSQSLSNITRQLALAGVALVWLFKTSLLPTGINNSSTDAGLYLIQDELYNALCFFILCLVSDYLQYFYKSFAWGTVHTWHDVKIGKNTPNKEEIEINQPWPVINWPAIFFFWAKALSVGAGYYFAMKYISMVLLPSGTLKGMIEWIF